jgi:DeoR/GlpR family transcriptional regulator of sugar metabolism
MFGLGQTSSSAAGRRQEIVELLLERDSVTVRELVERFAVSAMTVHRDLDVLEERGVLRKVRGGATAQPTGVYESSIAFRLHSMQDAKRRIARRAAQYVEAGSSLVLDDSTTALAMIPELRDIPQLTLVTNFVSIVEAAADVSEGDLTVVGVGGTYNPKYHAFGGVIAERALRDLRVDRCFLSVPAVDLQRAGIFHQEPGQAAIKRTMTEIASESTLLADASKFGKSAVHRIVDLSAFQRIIVDDSIAPATVSALRGIGVAVEVAGPDHPSEHDDAGVS